MSICVLCQQPFAAGDTILEQRLVADTKFCNICFTEFMVEQGDSNIFSSIRWHEEWSDQKMWLC